MLPQAQLSAPDAGWILTGGGVLFIRNRSGLTGFRTLLFGLEA